MANAAAAGGQQDGWDSEEWDVLAVDAGRCAGGLPAGMDRGKNEWRLEAFYD